MVSDDVIRYLQDGRRRGFGFPVLRQKLLQNGFSDGEINEAINSITGRAVQKLPLALPEKITTSGSLGFFHKIWKSISAPTELFEKTEGEGIWNVLIFQILILILPISLVSVLLFFWNEYIEFLLLATVTNMSVTFFSDYSKVMKIVVPLSLFVIVPVMFLLISTILHLIMNVYNGQGNFSGTYKAVVYSSTPFIILSTIPFVNIINALWSLVILVFGLTVNHKISKTRATFSLISIILFFVVIWLTFYAINKYSS